MRAAKSTEKAGKAQDTPVRAHESSRPQASYVPQNGVSEIQQSAGNLAVQRLLASGLIQAKLSVSQPNDPYEQEADRVAERVMSSASAPSIQRKCDTCAAGGTCPKCDEEQKIQTKELPGHVPRGTPNSEASLESLNSGGHALSPASRAFFEPRFGQDLSHVMVHTDAQAAEAARSISARAFTVGQRIAFGAGQYSPESREGQQLLAHELTHVMQQGNSSSNLTVQRQLFLDPIEFGRIVEFGKEFTKTGELPKSGGGRPITIPPPPETSPLVGPKPSTGTEGSGTPQDDPARQRDPECGSKKMPLTMVSFFPGQLGQGGRVKASPLTKCPGNTQGSLPDNAIYKPQFECINAAGEGGSWVRAHILHGMTTSSGPFNLHGPGNDVRNLIIADQSLNQKMRGGAEGPAIARVYGANQVLWYDSKVDSYAPGKEFFAQSITVSFGQLDTNTGSEGPAIGGGTFGLKKTPPNCTPSALGGTTPSAQGTTPPVPSGATATTPRATLVRQGTFGFRDQLYSEGVFHVSKGGIEVWIQANWFNAAGDSILGPPECPVDHYFVRLEQKGYFFGFNSVADPIKVSIGKGFVLRWTRLDDDDYRLMFYNERPTCLLKGTFVISTFDAPQGPIMA